MRTRRRRETGERERERERERGGGGGEGWKRRGTVRKFAALTLSVVCARRGGPVVDAFIAAAFTF